MMTVTDHAIRLEAGPDHYHNKVPCDIPLYAGGEKASKRRIRFAPIVSEVVGIVLCRDDFSEEEKNDYWIGSGLLQTRARLLMVAVKKHGPAYVDCIEDSYKEAQNLSESMVDDDAIDLFFEDPGQFTEKMEMRTEYDQRGLEQYISPLQNIHRASEKREVTLMVLVAANMGVSDDELADLYAALSWMACIYSRMLGHADYTAAYFTESTPVQPEPVQMPALKVETQSETAIRDLKLKVLQGLKLKRVPMICANHRRCQLEYPPRQGQHKKHKHKRQEPLQLLAGIGRKQDVAPCTGYKVKESKTLHLALATKSTRLFQWLPGFRGSVCICEILSLGILARLVYPRNRHRGAVQSLSRHRLSRLKSSLQSSPQEVPRVASSVGQGPNPKTKVAGPFFSSPESQVPHLPLRLRENSPWNASSQHPCVLFGGPSDGTELDGGVAYAVSPANWPMNASMLNRPRLLDGTRVC